MAEEKSENILHEFIEPNQDDMSVLNYLLQTIKGISLVSGSPMGDIALEDEVEF